MANIPWGKPRIFTFNSDTANNGKCYELATPVENSTNLTPTKGEKLEAKVEGGDNEDVKYKKSTYTTAFNIRKAKGRKPPYPSHDGVVEHHYGIILVPEDPKTEGFLIESNTIGIDDTFTAADGAIWAVSADAVKAVSGDTVKWGTVEVTTENSTTTVSFTERSSAGSTAYTRSWTVDATEQSGTAAGDNS